MIVVAIGNAFDGIILRGPFATVDGAAEWAESNVDDDWNILSVWSVDDSDEWDEGYEDEPGSVEWVTPEGDNSTAGDIDRFEEGYEF